MKIDIFIFCAVKADQWPTCSRRQMLNSLRANFFRSLDTTAFPFPIPGVHLLDERELRTKAQWPFRLLP